MSESPERAACWEREYRTLLESLPDAVFVQDMHGRVLLVNEAAQRLSGFAKHELLGINMRQLLTPQSYIDLCDLLAPAETGLKPSWCIAELVNLSGTHISVELHPSVVSDGGRCHLIARELTEHNLSVEAAHNSESRFRLMAKNLTDMVLAYDMQRRLIFANPAARDLTGYSPEDLEREQFICWIHPDDRERMLSHWDRLFIGESFYEEEYRLVTKDGRIKWAVASWGPIVNDHGEQVGVQGRERDVTERKLAEETWHQTEQRLRIDEERYRALFENSPFPMWEENFSSVKEYLELLLRSGVHDLREYLNTNREAVEECLRRVKVIDVNRAAREFYGTADKQQLLESLPQLFDDQAFETFRDEIATLAETNSVFKTEFLARTLKGEPRSVSMIVTVTGSPNLDWSRVIVSFFDITDRKHLEEQVLQSQKLESLGRLAGGIAHDFNNLLTVINGYSDWLLKQLDPQDTVGSCIAAIKSAGERGAELTQQLLAFSRKQPAQLRPMSVNVLVQESQELLRRMIGADVTLTLSLEPDLGAVKADQGQMHQVLMNLVMNAREAMPGGGALTIETANVCLGTSLQEQNTPGGRPFVRLSVVDTGQGIDEPTRKHLFEPFFTTKSVRKGTGLGLATVFGIVTQAGGHISVTSEAGKGAAFKIYLPSIDSPAMHEDVRRDDVDSFHSSGTVLVVEDQEEVRRLTCILLRELGFDILATADASEALMIMEQHGSRIQILLTDIIMPGMNGRELAERLLHTYPALKVIFMSGYTDRVMGENGEIEASLAFLPKPFTRAKLIEVLRKVAN